MLLHQAGKSEGWSSGNFRHEDAIDTYIQVFTWQTALLQNQRNDIEIARRRFEAGVLLV